MRCFINLLRTVFLILFCFSIASCSRADEPEELAVVLNEVIATLKGAENVEPIFKTISQACDSSYINCNINNEIIGIDLQFSNLGGTIPIQILRFEKLESIRLDHNYLKGIIPEGFLGLSVLKELNLKGNILEDPLPVDLASKSELINVDLSQNAFSDINEELIVEYNITDQVDLSKYVRVSDLSETVYGLVSNYPLFPGCDHLDTEDQERTCSNEKVVEFLNSNIVYPRASVKNSVEGLCVLKFTVETDGDLVDIEVVRDLGHQSGNAAMWVVDRMNYLDMNWTPGRLENGDIVNVRWTLPVKFEI